MSRPLKVVNSADTASVFHALQAALSGDGPAILPHPGQPEGLPETVEQRVAVVVETSGSTGRPKRVALGADALLASAAASDVRLGGPGQWLIALPAHYIAGINVLVRSLAAQTEPITVAANSTRFVDAANELDAGLRFVSLVPTQLRRLLDAGTDLTAYDAVLLGAAAAPADLLRRAAEAGAHVVTTYGMSETCGGCVYDGVPLEGVRVDLTDDSRVRIAGPMIMSGYLDEGPVGPWLATQDLGHWQSGRLVIDGRIDDVINSGGLKIAAGQVLDQIRATGMVRDGLVLGLADATWGQVVTAVVVPGRGWRGPEALRDLVGRRLGRTHAPRVIVEVDELPMLASGKIDRVEVRRITTATLESGAAWRV